MYKKKSGFTLTELLTAVSISTILVLTSGMVISNGLSSWRRGQRRIALDSDAASAVLMIERYFREGSGYEIDVSGERIDIFEAGTNNVHIIFDKSGESLRKTDLNAGTTMDVVQNVSSLSFISVGESTVEVQLNLQDEPLKSFLSTTLKHRSNY